MATFIDSDELLDNIHAAINNAEQYFLHETNLAPVVHAHWTRKRTLSHDGELYCSNCEWTPEVLGCATFEDLQLADVYYCPHCGAKMDEEV